MSETEMTAAQQTRIWALRVAFDLTVGRDIDASDTILIARFIATGASPYDDAKASAPLSPDEMRSHP